jgi:hypothetical protein
MGPKTCRIFSSLHLTRKDRDEYIKEYWDKMPDEVPDEYSRPEGEPTVVDVDLKTYNKIKKSKNGIQLI